MISTKTIMIVEDDVLISEHLKLILEELDFGFITICSSFNSVLEELKSFTPDMALLDIRLNGVDDGLKIGEHFSNEKIPFCYITSFSDKETIKKAIFNEPKGFLIKPFEKTEIIELVEKLMASLPQKISFKSGTNIVNIEIDTIIFIKSDNVYVEIYTENDRFIIRNKLEEILSNLPKNFIRIHRSYAVNSNKIIKITTSFIEVPNYSLPISKKYKEMIILRKNGF
jgi:two-component system response regulator LytT